MPDEIRASADLSNEGSRDRAVERPELDRAAQFPPGMLDLITRDLAAGLAEAVLLALWNRQSVVLFSSTDAGTAVDPAVLAEGPGFVGRALRLERAAEGHVDSGLSAEAILGAADRALLTAKVAGGGIVAVSELDLGPLP